MRVWMAQGSLIAAGDSTRWARGSRWTSWPRDDAQNGRSGLGARDGMSFSDEYDSELRRATRGAGRGAVPSRRGASGSETRRAAVGDGAVEGRGRSRRAMGGLVRAHEVALGRLGAVRTGHGATTVRQGRGRPFPPTAKAARRSSRLRQLSAPAMPTSDEARGDLAAKVSVVLGVDLLGHVDVSVPTTRGTAAALGRVQTGEVEQEILANMWEDWGLLSAYRFGLWKKAWRARERGSQVGLCR